MQTLLWRPGLQLPAKDPSDTFLLEIQWADKLGTDTISAANVSATDITVTVDSFTADTLILKVAAGTPGQYYTVTFSIDSVGGQHFERSVIVPVAEQ